MSKVLEFKKLPVNAAFTPAPGEKDSGGVFIKKLNGCCPKLLSVEEAIFWPNDKVMTVDVPKKILERALRDA